MSNGLPDGALDTVEGRKLALHFLDRDIRDIRTNGVQDPEARRRLSDIEKRQNRLADAMNGKPPEPPRDALSQLWHTVLSGVVAPFKAFAAARTGTQLIVAVSAVLIYLMATDQLIPLVDALSGGVEITVEDGAAVVTDDLEADEVDLEAETVNIEDVP